MFKSEAKRAVEATKAARQRLRDLEAEREQILAESTDARLEANRRATSEAIAAVAAAERDELSLVGEAPLPDEAANLRAKIRESQDREFGLISREMGGVCSDKFVRPDATEFFRRELDEAEQREREINRSLAGKPHVSVTPAGRLHAELEHARSLREQWKSTQKHAAAGEKIHALREERRNLTEQLEKLLADHRVTALSA